MFKKIIQKCHKQIPFFLLQLPQEIFAPIQKLLRQGLNFDKF